MCVCVLISSSPCLRLLNIQAAMGMQEAQAVANANFDCRWQLQGNWSLAKSVVSDGLRVADEDSPSVADVRSPVTASDETRVTPASSVRQCILVRYRASVCCVCAAMI